MLTNPLLSFDLSFPYNLEVEITSVDLKNFDTFPVRITINSLIPTNLPNLKKIGSKTFRISRGFCSFFKSIFKDKFNLMPSRIRISDAFCD